MNVMESVPLFFDTLPVDSIPEWMNDSAVEEQTVHCTQQSHHRSIWISDVHLGTSGAKAEEIRMVLKDNGEEI